MNTSAACCSDDAVSCHVMHEDTYSPSYSIKTCPETCASGLSQSCTSVTHWKVTLHLFGCFVACKCFLPVLICKANGLQRLMSSVMNETIQNCWVIEYARVCVSVCLCLHKRDIFCSEMYSFMNSMWADFPAVYWLMLALSTK